MFNDFLIIIYQQVFCVLQLFLINFLNFKTCHELIMFNVYIQIIFERLSGCYLNIKNKYLKNSK